MAQQQSYSLPANARYELYDGTPLLAMTEARREALRTVYRNAKRLWSDMYRNDWQMDEALAVVESLLSELEATQ